jgi:hypothetical protein
LSANASIDAVIITASRGWNARKAFRGDELAEPDSEGKPLESGNPKGVTSLK